MFTDGYRGRGVSHFMCTYALALSLFTVVSYGVLWQQVTWVLCIYIIFDKVCHILYIFGLNSTVCRHIEGVHLSSNQVNYYFMMDGHLYNKFLLPLPIRSF